MKNRYAGINPHLNSLLQTPGTDSQPEMWTAFHFSHIAHITDFLNRELPDHYLALSEVSLQKREIDNEEIEFEGDDYLTAAIIRDLHEQPPPGKIITRIELLSPASKPGGFFFSTYKINRIKTLQTNTSLIEIDLLHETPSLMISPPRYPNEPGSYPYAISVYDLHHGAQHGKLSIYNLDVNQPLPTILIPLADDETLVFDFDAVYQYTFVEGRWGKFVDYRQLPARFETYSPADQARIRHQMEAIAAQP